MHKPQKIDSYKRKTHFALLLLFFAAGSLQLLQAQAKFYASAPKSVPVNQAFQLSYTLENANGGSLKLPPLNDFQLIGGPNTSTNMQWVNGNVTQSVTYTYVLKPKKEGTFKIEKAGIQVSKVTMESNELTIEVTKAAAQSQTQQRQRNPFDPFADDPFFNPQSSPEPEVSQGDIEKQLKDDVFMKLEVNRNAVYKGEMLTATYKLYFRQNLAGFNVTKAPAFDGFWSQEVELDPKRRPMVETINGKQYNVVDILKYNLYPQRSGGLTIPLAEVETVAQIQVRSRNRNFFDDFFSMGRVQQVPLHLKTSTAVVTVKDLPENGKPTDFNGAVGKFSYEAKLSNKEAKTDEPITYTIKITGAGNLKFIESPTLQLPEAFEVYDPKTKENITNTTSGLSGTKQYDYLIIPRQPGEYIIQANSFSYFDPSQGKYFTLRSPEFSVKVTGEPSKNMNASVTNNSQAKAEVELLGKDIRYIKTNVPDFENPKSTLASFGFAAVYATPILMFVGLIALKRRNENLAADITGTKRRRALKLAKKRLVLANKLLLQNDKNGFYTEVSKAIWGYLADKLNIDLASLSKESAEEKLLLKNVSAGTISKFKTLLGTCELALYSPIGEGGEMKQNYQAAINMIADFEDEIKT
jgi:hypothetical protein